MHFFCGSDGYISVAKEGIAGHITGIAFSAAESIDHPNAFIGNAQIVTMYTAFRTVHATVLGTIAVVEQLPGQTG